MSAVTDLLCLQAPRDVCLAAADDATRQRCVRVIQAASAGGASSSLHHIASAAALTGELLKMKSLPAVNAVMAALGKAEVGGLDVPSLKAPGFTYSDFRAAGFDPKSLQSEGYDVLSLIADFGYDAVASSGCDMSSIVLVPPPLCKVHSTGGQPQRKRRAPNPRPHTL